MRILSVSNTITPPQTVRGVQTLVVPKLHTKSSNDRYRWLNSKLWLWNFTEYDKIVYYDLDIRIQGNPARCVSKCPESAELCASRDPVATWPKKDPLYFNAGFLILKPNKVAMRRMMQKIDQWHKYGEQDIINAEYRHNYFKLPKHCNWLHSTENHPGIARDLSVVHVHTS